MDFSIRTCAENASHGPLSDDQPAPAGAATVAQAHRMQADPVQRIRHHDG